MTEPPCLRARPHIGGLPIPFVTAYDRGRPDFRAHDPLKRSAAAARRLCQLCGRPLGERFVFVGLRPSVEARTFGEPPMHRVCFDFAAEVCPWIAGADWRDDWRNVAAEVHYLQPPPSRGELGVCTTSSYRMVNDRSGLTPRVFRAGDLLEPVEWIGRG